MLLRAVQVIRVLPKTTHDVGKLLSTIHAQENIAFKFKYLLRQKAM